MTVPATKYNHLCATNEIGRMIKSCYWCTATFRTLIPSHCDRIKRMKVSENSLGTFATKYYNSGTCKDCCMSITSWWWRSTDLGFEPTWTIYIKDVSIIQISKPCSLAFIEMSSENNEWCSCQSCCMSAPWCWWDSLNLWKRPEPLTFDFLLAFLLLRLLRIFHYLFKLLS
jgi:hypothetical protein